MLYECVSECGKQCKMALSGQLDQKSAIQIVNLL